MLTIHAAGLLLTGAGAGAAVPGGAVVVDGSAVAALGPLEEVAAAHPGARVRRWPGLITPGLRQEHGEALLERTYHPDPREYDAVGDRPLTGERLAALEMSESRWAGSVRRGLQQMLRHGTTAVAGEFTDPVVRTAVARSGLRAVLAAGVSAAGVPGAEPDLDPFRSGGGFAGPLTVGGRAGFAVFDVPDEAALLASGAGTCVATVLAGRLVFRGR
ncbi:hypothetical protein I5Q34_12310 [Streptomyces sp. AV19]|uniref:imidazolonepropionase-like domain-containing protein n=1 Tax=Streptomyces sp. AV19 TaxID=2793068 RepID=UPI0018FED262|nr:hypothetical protein [Streptomyces sp. AV19]MBH1935051.1 hypothetical protein [Streptomyces sp. AV19]MDG4530984.1 hypothetical protein [Streptomyces sp. AV19]